MKKPLLSTIAIATTMIAAPALAAPPQVIGNIIQLLDGDGRAVVLEEFSADSRDECLDKALLFNTEAKGTGYLMFCWEYPAPENPA